MKRLFALAGTCSGVLILASCSSVRFADAPPNPPGYGPYTLLFGNEPASVYSSEILTTTPIGNILGLNPAVTLLTREPPSRKSGWLTRQYRDREDWQILSTQGYRVVTVHGVMATAAGLAFELRGAPAYTHQMWWLVGVRPLRLAAYRYKPGEEVDYYGSSESLWLIFGAKGFTHAQVFLVDGDDLDRPVEAVATYTGALYQEGLELSGPYFIEQDKLDVQLTHNEFTIGDLIKRYAGQEH